MSRSMTRQLLLKPNNMKFEIEPVEKEFKPFTLKLKIETKDDYDILLSFLENTEPQTFMYAEDIVKLIKTK